MSVPILQDRKENRVVAFCPDCEIRANKIWIFHEYKWIPIGVLCKKCGYIEIGGVAENE